MAASPKILVIKLGALGDIVQAMGAAAAIRVHHQGAQIVLLTTRPYAELMRQAPYFDNVWIDERPRDPLGLWRLARRLRAARFDRVYDLSTRQRSALYFRLMRRPLWSDSGPEWSGIARGASHRQPDTQERRRMHTLDREVDQLRWAGFSRPIPPPDLSWAMTDLSHFVLPPDYVLLLPGAAPHRPEKRWPLAFFIELARRVAAMGLTPVIIGGPAERELGAAIADVVPEARDLTGQTQFGDIVALGRGARRAIGNDTGPMHLAVVGGAPATVLYSAASDPSLTAPRGRDVVVLRRDNLADLSVDEVVATLSLEP
ncbi:MAG TPA: glycosyltransferase family 9 protein [Stellaceae bacterium]|nr:glycosyltransferase family 9 protein [Stellaceae bacterium]